MMMAACVDSDYSFDDIDATIGIGGDQLQLPASSTSVIYLSDVLSLPDDGCVKEQANGDYVFEQASADVQAATPSVSSFYIEKETSISLDFLVNLPSQQAGARMHRAVAADIRAEGNINVFTYKGEMPEEAHRLVWAGVNSNFDITIHVEKLAPYVSDISRLSLQLPAYLQLQGVTASHSAFDIGGGNVLQFTNVPTNRSLTIKGKACGIDFTAKDNVSGSITQQDGWVTAKGSIYATMTITELDKLPPAGQGTVNVSSQINMDGLLVTEAKGYFSPAISLDNLGEVQVNRLPDFLEDGNVVADLYNPQIVLQFDNNMDIAASLSGNITAQKDGRETARIALSGISIQPNGVSKVCICRNAQAITGGPYTQVVEVGNLSDMLRTIPSHIGMSATVKADGQRLGSIMLDHRYNIKPSYEVTAPIAFAKDAQIVYRDTINGWTDEMEDIDMSQDAVIVAEAVIDNRLPAYLTVSAHAIDSRGDAISGSLVSIDTSTEVLASGDGTTTVSTPLTLTLRQHEPGAISRVDGLVLRVSGTATSQDGQGSVVGQTLNARNHSLTARDIKITLKGRIIKDMN